jgi:hypothetical protein
VILFAPRADEAYARAMGFMSASAAVKNLAERRVLPDEVVALGKRKGEGLEAWARAKSRLPSKTKHLKRSAASSATGPSRKERKTEYTPCKFGVLTDAADVRTTLERICRTNGPLFCRNSGDKGAVSALVAIEVDANPVSQPNRTRKLLFAGLKDYATKVRPKTHPETPRSSPRTARSLCLARRFTQASRLAVSRDRRKSVGSRSGLPRTSTR